MTELFGTDGIRGQAGEFPLTYENVQQHIGHAIGTYFADNEGVIPIGFDTRASSPVLAEALSRGIRRAGVDVEMLGVTPTPAVAYRTRERDDALAGVVITASHNPYQDNGIKVFNAKGEKLTDKTQAVLNELMQPDQSRFFASQCGEEIIDHGEARENYLGFLVDSVRGEDFSEVKIALDMAHGATSGYAKRLFKELGAHVLPLACRPNGKNINEQCGAVDTRLLKAFVRNGYIGAAFDGDGDRIMMVDEKGRQLNGDHMLYINAVAQGELGVVATQMSNKGLEDRLWFHSGIDLHRTNVGDRYVMEGLRETHYKLGGEQSGHIIFPDIIATGDGMLAAIQTIKNYRQKQSLAEWYDELPMLPQAIVNISGLPQEILEEETVQALLEERSAEIGVNGRLFVRASGTEKKIRVMVESSDDAEALARDVASELEALSVAKKS